MRENKKVLKFKKFKIANLQSLGVVGGTDSNPCGTTDTQYAGTPEQNTSLLTQCTVLAGRTDIRNGCTDPDSAEDTTGTHVSG